MVGRVDLANRVKADHRGPLKVRALHPDFRRSYAHEVANLGALICADAVRRDGSRVTYRTGVEVWSGLAARGGEVEVFGWFRQLERVEDGLLAAGGGGALRDAAVGGGQGDQVHAVELVAQVAPGVADCGFGDADEQQREPAERGRGCGPPDSDRPGEARGILCSLPILARRR
jgi:hypothetical protein